MHPWKDIKNMFIAVLWRKVDEEFTHVFTFIYIFVNKFIILISAKGNNQYINKSLLTFKTFYSQPIYKLFHLEFKDFQSLLHSPTFQSFSDLSIIWKLFQQRRSTFWLLGNVHILTFSQTFNAFKVQLTFYFLHESFETAIPLEIVFSIDSHSILCTVHLTLDKVFLA